MLDDEKPIALIIEDHDDVAAFIASCLNDQYAIVHEGDGPKGLNRAVELMPDIVVTDVMIPIKDGEVKH